MKKLITLIVFALFFFISCGDNTEDEQNDENYVNDSEMSDEDVTEQMNDESEDSEEESDDDSHGDPLADNWLVPDDEWESWATLKVMGPIMGQSDEYEPAVYIDGRIKLASGVVDLTDGDVSLFDNEVYNIHAVSYEFLNLDEDAGTATVDYYNANFQFPRAVFPEVDEDIELTTGFGAFVTFTQTLIDIEFDENDAVTSQLVRKNCYLAISKIGDVTVNNETKKLPVGDIWACFCDGKSDVGDDAHLMFKNEMDESQEALFNYYNRQQDGTVAQYGDENFMHLCQCYDEEGNEVNCWQYDGPGGAEECPDYVPEEHCNPAGNDNDEVSDNNVDEENDEDIE